MSDTKSEISNVECVEQQADLVGKLAAAGVKIDEAMTTASRAVEADNPECSALFRATNSFRPKAAEDRPSAKR